MTCRMEDCPNWNGHGCIRGYIDSCDPNTDADETRADVASEWTADLSENDDLTFNDEKEENA